MTTWTERFKAAEPFFVGIGLPLVAIIVGFAAPVLYDHGRELAEIKTKIDGITQHIDDKLDGVDKLENQRFADLNENIGNKIDALAKDLDTRFGEVTRSLARDDEAITSVNKRVDLQETDPNKLLTLIGVNDQKHPNEASAVTYRGYIYVIPRTQAAYAIMLDNGFTPERLSPTISAFRVTTKGLENMVPKPK